MELFLLGYSVGREADRIDMGLVHCSFVVVVLSMVREIGMDSAHYRILGKDFGNYVDPNSGPIIVTVDEKVGHYGY